MTKMKWDGDGQRASVRNAGGERAGTCKAMRRDPIQAAGAEIELPDKHATQQCPETLCGMRRELLNLQAENLHLIRDELIALRVEHLEALLEIKRLKGLIP